MIAAPPGYFAIGFVPADETLPATFWKNAIIAFREHTEVVDGKVEWTWLRPYTVEGLSNSPYGDAAGAIQFPDGHIESFNGEYFDTPEEWVSTCERRVRNAA